MILTILTPSYNREHTLGRLYESLKQQNNQSFQWLIVDDGSSDGTKALVETFIAKDDVNVKYLYKVNGGKHTAINAGFEVIDTPLTFIVDSDDYLTKDAVQTIVDTWEVYKDRADVGSFWYLQIYTDGKIAGDKFPIDGQEAGFTEVITNMEIKGEKRSVYRTDLRKQYPFPVFPGERFGGLSTVHKRIGDKYKCVFMNKVIYVGDYLEDGITVSGRLLRIKYPLGGMENSKEFLSRNVRFKIRLKKMILYGTYGFFAKKKLSKIITYSGHPVFATLCAPFYYGLYKYWGRKFAGQY